MRLLLSGDFPLVLNPPGERRDIRGGGGVERRLGDLDRIILKKEMRRAIRIVITRKIPIQHFNKFYPSIAPSVIIIYAVVTDRLTSAGLNIPNL